MGLVAAAGVAKVGPRAAGALQVLRQELRQEQYLFLAFEFEE